VAALAPSSAAPAYGDAGATVVDTGGLGLNVRTAPNTAAA
jgi:hypothetical protein